MPQATQKSSATAPGHPTPDSDGATDATEPSTPGVPPDGPDAAVRRRWWRRPEAIGIAAVLAGLIAVLTVHLGPALVGAKTFSAMDRLMSVAPWWNGGPKAPVMNPFLGDSIDSLIPSYIQIRERLAEGDWALWSSLAGPGTELLASTNTPTLTLSTIWFLALPTVYATGFVKLVEIALAMGGMYLWMRRIGLGRPASLLAGVFYCGSGFFVGWATWSAQASVAAMMPALFWAIERFIARKTLRSALPIAVVVALLLLGGFPAAAGHALYAGGLYFIVRLIADRAAHPGVAGFKLFAAGVGAVILGVALSAVQVLPLAFGLADTDLSVRSGQFFSQQPLSSFMSMFFPGSLFDLGYGPDTNPIEAYAFLGMGAVFFAAVAVLTPRLAHQAKAVVPFLAVGALLAAAVVWYQGWWTAWLSGLPVFSGNNSGRLRDIVCLFACALAAIGVERIFTAAEATRKRLLVITAVALLGFGALTVLIWWLYPDLSTRTLALDAVPALLIIALAGVAVVWFRRRAVRTAAFAGVALLAALQMSTSVSNYWPLNDVDDFYPELALIDRIDDEIGADRVLTSGSFMGSTAAAYGVRSATAHSFQPTTWREYLEALQLGAFGAGQSPTNPTLTFPGTETAAQTALLDRLGAAAWTTSFDTIVPGEIQTPSGGAWAAPAAGGGTVQVAAGTAIEVPLSAPGIRAVTITVVDAVPPQTEGLTVTAEVVDAAGAVVATGEAARSHLNPGPLTFAVAGEDLPSGDLTLRLTASVPVGLAADSSGAVDVGVTVPTDDGLQMVYADSHGTVWTRESALPRIRWAGSSVVEEDAQARLALLADPALDRDTVVLSADGAGAGDGGDAELEVTADTGDAIDVTVDAETGGHLVVADWMHRGWRVTVDGEPAEIVEADHAMSAVYVPAGTHEVAFTYTGVGVVAGAAVSGLSLVVVAGVVIVTGLRRRRADDHGDAERTDAEGDAERTDAEGDAERTDDPERADDAGTAGDAERPEAVTPR
ncbi:putative membrane protein YqjE [Microbacterium terrae]|uniref:Bacterial membrane protein YfhO n=1 Tax=Microbacterium terrae TaxID=69369 RepID=A0A0M2HC98_9MICO|nr:YfhO family protein [Microbacterium terrae]KJL41733.1 Bacterial membrane protein YfhO [Microbacterium terrae]MBP1077976.1 putative membrane protein YqjE [Microbacterium terrae]